jgi:hypothetical protein
MRQFTTGAGISEHDAHTALRAYRTHGQRELEQKHAEFLARLGKAPAGLRPRSIDLPSRHTHCYSCRESLSSSVDLECIACGWILCQCGACGCGYSKA